MIDAGVEAEVQVRIHNFARDAADVLVADGGVIFNPAAGGKPPPGGKAERRAVLVEKIFLLETKPGAGVIRNRARAVARMRGLLVGHEHLAHDECAVFLGGVGIELPRVLSMQSESCPRPGASAAIEVPPGSSFEFGNFENSLRVVLPRRLATGS